MNKIKYILILVFLILSSDRALPDAAVTVFAQTERSNVSAAAAVSASENKATPLSTEKPLVIPHAGGMIDKEPGTNSLDALQASYISGFRIMELDFNWTSDGNLALIHDWEQQSRFCPELSSDTVPTSLQFEEVKIIGKYDSLTIGSLAEWMIENPDVFVVTDIKKDNVKALSYMKGNYPNVSKRMIPQIYSYEEYEPVRALGYEDIILTLYAMTYEEKTNTKKIIQFAAENHLYAVTIDKTLLPQVDMDAFRKSGLTLYAHTVNDAAEAKRLMDTGVFGVYSDSLPVQIP